MTGIVLILLLWVFSKVIEAIWERLTRSVKKSGLPGADEVAEVLSPKKSALSEDAEKFVKAIDQKLKETVRNMGR